MRGFITVAGHVAAEKVGVEEMLLRGDAGDHGSCQAGLPRSGGCGEQHGVSGKLPLWSGLLFFLRQIIYFHRSWRSKQI